MSGPVGILDSLKALVATLVAMVHNRVELLSTELQEELARLVAVLIWSLAALLGAVVGLTFVAVLILLSVDESHRPLAAGILAAVFLAAAGGSYLHVRGLVEAKPRTCDASLSELEKDYDGLKGGR